MSTFFPKTERSLIEQLMIRLLKNGEIPTHIGFIMDGNRRYAQKLQVENGIGHSKGFEKLAETLSWCRDLGITQATVYAFSIENFKRPKDEVDGLMNLFRKQFEKLLEEFHKLESFQICMRIYGRLDLLPLDIQQSVAKVVLRTVKNKKFYLNICFAYTAREEMVLAFNDLSKCVSDGIIEQYDINDATLSKAMYSLGMHDPDILLRTSGEIRLSDYLLWQTKFSYIIFEKELWPEFSIWSFFFGILRYQVQLKTLKQALKQHNENLLEADLRLCEKMYQSFSKVEKFSNINGFRNNLTRQKWSFEEFVRQRQLRIEKCFEYIKDQRLNALRDLLNDTDLKEIANATHDECNLNDKINNNSVNNGFVDGVNKNIKNNINGYTKAL